MFSRITDGELSDIAVVCESAARTVVSVYQFIQRGNEKRLSRIEKARLDALSGNVPFNYSGTIYDMSVFWHSKAIPVDTFKSLPSSIQKKVREGFDSLYHNGYVKLSPDQKYIMPTEKGIELINDRAFVCQALLERDKQVQKVQKVVRAEQIDRKIFGVKKRPGANPGSSAATKTTGTSKAAANAAREVSTKEPVQTAVKAAAASTAKASAGAVTAGIATAVDIGYKIASGGIKVINEKTL